MNFSITQTAAAAVLLVLTLIPIGPGQILRADQPATRPAAVTVQPGADLTADELAALMGECVWKFNVTLPPGAHAVKLVIEERPKSGKSIQLASTEMPVTSDAPHRMIAALLPDGPNRFRISVIGWRGIAFATFDDAQRTFSNSIVLKNPERYPDGAFALVGGYGSGDGSLPAVEHAQTVIALKILPQSAP